MGFIFYLVLSNAGIVFHFFVTEEKIRSISLGYLSIVAFAAIPITLFQVFRGYSEGITQTRIVFTLGLLGFLKMYLLTIILFSTRSWRCRLCMDSYS